MFDLSSFDLQNFLRTVRLVDFLDVLVISVFLYLLLNWIRNSASRRAIISMSLLLSLYVLARLTEMYLTKILIEGLFVVIIIGIVVVFQSDIRHLIDRIGNWSLFWERNSSSTDSLEMDIITEASAKLADNKTGALIVIKGEDEWDRHITGGIDLKGSLSLPLLFSIFDPGTPGHDGALLIQDGHISKFGAHLPLSNYPHKTPQRGTRHAAAVGLSERCDALVIVISEERGTISVAQNGELTELDSTSDLKSYLADFWKEHYQNDQKSISLWRNAVSPRIALISIVIATLLWFAFAYNFEIIYRSFSVPIEFRNLQNSNVMLEDSVPAEARVILAGPEQAFRAFDPSELVISFNLDSSDHLNLDELLITEQNIELPSDMRLYDVSPQSLQIRLKEFVYTQVPVNIATQGTLPSPLELVSMRPDPSFVSVRAPAGEVPDTLNTEPIDLGEITESGKIGRELMLPPNIEMAQGNPDRIVVFVEVQNKNNDNF